MQQTCKQCGSSFEITPDDLAFYDKVSPIFNGKKELIPPPTLCPECRLQRRLLWRREHALKSRTCSNCNAAIISVHPADAPFPVFCLKCWWSDQFDPLTFGKSLDLDRPFLDQFMELHANVPQVTMMNDNGVGSENCEYTQDFAFGKNCYLLTGAWELEDCYYSDCNCLKSRMLFDCYAVHFSELAYECMTSQHLYRCIGLNHCSTCSDCTVGIDLQGCRHCIGCINLRQKSFCIFNEQYSEAEYATRAAALHLDTASGLREFRERFDQWVLRFPRKNVHQVNCENCRGDDLFNCKNVYGFQFDRAEDCRYIVHGDAPKNCYDVNCTGRCEWCYEGGTPDNSYMTHFTVWCWKDKYVLYSDNCHSSEHLFGCISCKRRKYCILNTQYTQGEYEELVPKIIDRMRQGHEWGEFISMPRSPYCYNETAAQDYFPRTKEQISALGLRWSSEDRKQYLPATTTVPDRITDVSDGLIGAILSCESCGKNYKILAQELSFYRNMQLPVPRCCYDCRFQSRLARLNPRKLWSRACGKCGKDIETSYAPDRPEIVYCEECYLQEVY